jgi:hypothetical protein
MELLGVSSSSPSLLRPRVHRYLRQMTWSANFRSRTQKFRGTANPLFVLTLLVNGKFDSVVLGSQKDVVVIGVVSGAHPDKVQLFSFPIRRDTQDGFCAVPKRIEASPLDCETDEGPLPRCNL